jgi:hypothetical protein
VVLISDGTEMCTVGFLPRAVANRTEDMERFRDKFAQIRCLSKLNLEFLKAYCVTKLNLEFLKD